MKRVLLAAAIGLLTWAIGEPMHPGGTVSLLPRIKAGISAKLGDLSPFRTCFCLDRQGDLVGAKSRIRDLETQWDDAEPALKPRAAVERHVVDKAIDRALEALRAAAPDAAKCKQTISELLSVMDTIGKS